MANLKIGDTAPAFSVPDQDNTVHTLAEYKGKKLALAIYVADGSKGCATELSNLESSYSEITAKGYQLLGVSKNSVESHQRFHEKLGLKFDLLSDADMTIIKEYGAYGPKGKKDGVEKMGVIRTTALIDENGKIAGMINEIDTKNAGTQLLDAISNTKK